MYLASEITPLWLASEELLQQQNIAPPFWAFAWPGSEALARHVMDHPELVAGKYVLDFASGCGLAAIAALTAGAAAVTAAEIDPVAAAAIALNGATNRVEPEILLGDLVGAPCRWEVILCGDICYEAPMTSHILPWLRLCARTSVVLIADPGRKYAPLEGCVLVASYTVPTSLALEDSAQREVKLFRLLALEQTDAAIK
ncbi:MAG TPA: 50S ribosomal protein L11 methyltransferase [Acidocella sp.]|nr:50S ribosomal protein L11 methyltransferase [Acidocella sp.]